MSGRRVVVTGLGAVSAFGHDRQAVLSGIQAGHQGIRRIESVQDERLDMEFGAEIPGEIEGLLPSKEDRSLDRCVQVGLIPAREAVSDAGIDFGAGDLAQRSAVVTGCAVGGRISEDKNYHGLYALSKKRFHPMCVPRSMGNAGASRISLEYGITGPVYNLSTACSSANHAMGQAFWMVRSGLVDAAITGGHEAFFCLGHLKAWDALRVVSPDTCRPFSKDRQGMILGEGGAMLVLESLEHARARDARIYAEVVGFGMNADAHHLTMPSLEGPARAMAAALQDGGIDPAAVSYINAHGTGTQVNDPNETRAIRQALGGGADRVAVSSSKSMHGHTLGAAGALEGVVTVLAIAESIFPPTINFSEVDPECDLDYVPNEARQGEIDVALSNSFAFGGLNAVLAFRRFSGN